MTIEEARRLKAGDRIVWRDGCRGAVEHVSNLGLAIAWDDGTYGALNWQWVHSLKLESDI